LQISLNKSLAAFCLQIVANLKKAQLFKQDKKVNLLKIRHQKAIKKKRD
jgi:hypothetical protein